MNGVDQMLYMKSTSGADGSYTLNVSFAVGSSPNLNAVNVSNRVNQILSKLPQEVQRSGVNVAKKSAGLLQVVTFYSPNGSKDALFLSNFAALNIIDTLARVPGVGQASQFGALEYSMRIWVDMDRLSSLGLTPNDVVKAIQSQNVQAAVGRIGSAPMIEGTSFQINLTAQGRLVSVETSEEIPNRSGSDVVPLRIALCLDVHLAEPEHILVDDAVDTTVIRQCRDDSPTTDSAVAHRQEILSSSTHCVKPAGIHDVSS